MIGAVLAGGAGRRMGGEKPSRPLCGRPLAAYPAAALAQVCEQVVVVAKAGTRLPPLAGVARWDELDEPRHPVTGIVAALERAGAPVLVCAADMPFVTAGALAALVAECAGERGRGVGQPAARAAVAVSGGILQPLLGVYAPAALPALRAAAAAAPLTRTVEALSPLLVELPPDITRSVDTPEQLAAAARELCPHVGGRRPRWRR